MTNPFLTDQIRAACASEIDNMISATVTGLVGEPDSTKVWAGLRDFFAEQCSMEGVGAEVACGVLAESLIRLAHTKTVPGAVALELGDLKHQVDVWTATVRELRWRLRATEYAWLADDVLGEHHLTVPDERWDRWRPR